MTMEGQSLVLFFALSGGALVLLFLIVVWQYSRIQLLEHRITDTSRNLARKQDGNGGLVLSLIDDAPFPICYTDLQGKILKASKPFVRLAGKECRTLADVAKTTGAQLAAAHNGHRHERVVLRGSTDEQLRHFSLVSWPVLGRYGTIGMTYALLEHTSIVRHSQEQHLFDQEVLALQEELVANLDKGTASAPLVQELKELTDFLRRQHHAHPQRTFEQFDLVRIIQDSLDEYRPHFRKRSVGVTATLPKRMMAAGYADEGTEVIQLLIAAIAEHAPAHSTVRLNLGRNMKHVTLTVSLPGIRGVGGSQNDIFSFGSKAGKRQGQVRMALARLLLGHQHGSLTVTADDDGGLVARVSFVAGKA